MGGRGSSGKSKGGGGRGTSNIRAEIDGKLRNIDNINQGIREITPILDRAPVGTSMEFSAYGEGRTIYIKESPSTWKKTWYNARKNQWSISRSSTKVTAGDVFNSAKPSY